MRFYCKSRKTFQKDSSITHTKKLSMKLQVWKATIEQSKNEMLILLEAEPGKEQEIHAVSY